MQKKKPWEVIDRQILVDAKWAKKVDGAFPIKGDSLEPFFHDGDVILVQSVQEVGHGEIGAFWVDGRVRIMRMNKDGDAAKLLPLNPDYPEVETADDVECIGRVIGRA